MKIEEWQKSAATKVDESLPHAKFQVEQARVEAAKQTVDAYEKYKLILAPKSIKNIKKYLRKYKPELGFICLHGDLQNLAVQYRGKWCQDHQGNITESDPDDTTYMGCSAHDEECIAMIDDFIMDVEGIDEFKEVVKILRKVS